MKKLCRRGLIAAGMAGILVFGLNPAIADEKKHKEKSEDEIGIRKETLYDESKVVPPHGEYGKKEPGKSKRIERAFENSPPLILGDRRLFGFRFITQGADGFIQTVADGGIREPKLCLHALDPSLAAHKSLHQSKLVRGQFTHKAVYKCHLLWF